MTPRAYGEAGSGWCGAEGLALYVHWPFCRSKCPYCDFNSHVRQSIDHDRWHRAILRELDHFAERVSGRQLISVFFGGGTPSLMDPETVAGLISRAGHHWRVDDRAEITLEANPTSSEASNFAAYAAAGINRLSLGIQSLEDPALRFLGREHSAAEARQAIELAQHHFPRVSFDLIYARPGQDPAAWRRELQTALAFSPSHLSLYQLTIEEGTRFHALRRRGALCELDDDAAACMFEETRALLDTAGLPAYEVSNHARPGFECRHNLTYWQSGDYVGIGPGAHGRLTVGKRRVATRQHRAPEAWLDLVERDRHATRETTNISDEDRLSEFVMMGLRLTEGIPRSAFLTAFGSQPEELIEPQPLEQLRESDLVVLDDHRLALTEKGLLSLNSVLAHLLA